MDHVRWYLVIPIISEEQDNHVAKQRTRFVETYGKPDVGVRVDQVEYDRINVIFGKQRPSILPFCLLFRV